ncbi:DUF4870 domain-containing protein [Candidatus Gracilibacteria bacterium]|nr:DUF4870 domain-containing protein [Candidatus Gracilibacteria bacterium]
MQEEQKQTVGGNLKEQISQAIPSDRNTTPEQMAIPKGEKTLAALGYVTGLCVLPLALKPKSEFCQFHGKQSLVIMLLFFVLSLITVLGNMIGVGRFFGFLFSLVQLILIVMGALNASQGKKWEIPFIAQVAKKWSFED